MEGFINVILVSIIWLGSVTVMLPLMILLKFSRKVRNFWFATFYSNLMMPLYNHHIEFMRVMCMDNLKAALSAKHDRLTPVKIVEIGVGPGLNLSYYPENSSLIALDINPSFERYFQKNKAKYPQVQLERVVKSFAEDMKEIPSNSVDAVISTYVLCYVKNLEMALSEILRILKPGGHFVFMEHTGYPKENKLDRRLQETLAPLWVLYSSGCNIVQQPGDLIENAGFSSVNIERLYPKRVWLVVRPHMVGIATK